MSKSVQALQPEIATKIIQLCDTYVQLGNTIFKDTDPQLLQQARTNILTSFLKMIKLKISVLGKPSFNTKNTKAFLELLWDAFLDELNVSLKPVLHMMIKTYTPHECFCAAIDRLFWIVLMNYTSKSHSVTNDYEIVLDAALAQASLGLGATAAITVAAGTAPAATAAGASLLVGQAAYQTYKASGSVKETIKPNTIAKSIKRNVANPAWKRLKHKIMKNVLILCCKHALSEQLDFKSRMSSFETHVKGREINLKTRLKSGAGDVSAPIFSLYGHQDFLLFRAVRNYLSANGYRMVLARAKAKTVSSFITWVSLQSILSRQCSIAGRRAGKCKRILSRGENHENDV